jgi:hypothetical protein
MLMRELPAPVARYLEAVLPPHARAVRHARLTQRGEFLVRPPATWRPFTATHELTACPPAFVWDARIRMFPGLAIRVRDSFLDGVGSMRGTLLGAIPIVAQEGTPEMAAGALQRYLAEAVWCPTALLPHNGIEWRPIDASRARAMIGASGVQVSLDFHFDRSGLIEYVYTPSRPRATGRTFEPTPWQGRFAGYEERGGMLIPLEGEVAWLLPGGPQTYWRGRIVEAAFAAGPPSSDPRSPFRR